MRPKRAQGRPASAERSAVLSVALRPAAAVRACSGVDKRDSIVCADDFGPSFSAAIAACGMSCSMSRAAAHCNLARGAPGSESLAVPLPGKLRPRAHVH
jgi:hypothetical protein